MILPGRLSQQFYEIINAVYALAQGGSNAVGTVTLEAGETTTTVSTPYMYSGSMVTLSPTTANAAGALATTYISAKAKGSFTVAHGNTASTDRTFDYEIRGN